MRIKWTNKQVNTLGMLLVMIVVMFNGFGSHILYLASGIFLMVIAATYFVISKSICDRKLYFAILAWSLFHLVLLIKNLSYNGAYVCFQHIGIILFFWMICNSSEFSGFDCNFIAKFYSLLQYIVLIFLLYAILTGSVKDSYESLIYIGLASLTMVFQSQEKQHKLLYIVLILSWMGISFAIGARAQVFSFLILFLAIPVFTVLENKKKLLKFFFWIYYVALNAFPMFYVYLSNSQYRSTLNTLAIHMTGSRFFSGRDYLWSSIYYQMSSPLKILTGLDITSRSNYITGGMSLHNLYVTLLAQGGILLILALGILFFAVWKLLVESNSKVAKVTMAFIIAVLYKQSFDISLVENNLWAAFSIWVAIGIGISLSFQEQVLQEYE